jgi:hypothetical protein
MLRLAWAFYANSGRGGVNGSDPRQQSRSKGTIRRRQQVCLVAIAASLILGGGIFELLCARNQGRRHS